MIDISLPRAREAQDTYAYTLEEVTAMPMRLPIRSAVVVSVAAFTGLRKGEISALMWEQYREGLLYVEKSRWRTHLSGPKTKNPSRRFLLLVLWRKSSSVGVGLWEILIRAGCLARGLWTLRTSTIDT
jgi:integrase